MCGKFTSFLPKHFAHTSYAMACQQTADDKYFSYSEHNQMGKKKSLNLEKANEH